MPLAPPPKGKALRDAALLTARTAPKGMCAQLVTPGTARSSYIHAKWGKYNTLPGRAVNRF